MRASTRSVHVPLALALGAALFSAWPASASTTVTMGSVAGSDRYATAGQAAAARFTTASSVVVTSGTTFPDALSASYLAGALGGPILLTDPTTLPAAAAAAISSLGATHATIVGGALAVSAAVEQQLVARGLTVDRISGPTRYDTSAAVATSEGPSHVGTVGGVPTAIVASGANFPDALATGPLAFAKALPVVLTDPSTLSPQTSGALRALGIKQVLIAGGPASVQPAVESAIQGQGITTVRLAGPDRFATAAQIAAYAVSQLGFSYTTTVLADGLTFADALAAGPFAGKSMSPILLTGGLPAATEAALAGNATAFTDVAGFGRAARDVPAAALAAGATLTVNGTMNAQSTVLCGFPSRFTFNGEIGAASPGAPGHLSATLTTSGATGPVDIDLTTPGTPIAIAYTETGAQFRANAGVITPGNAVAGTGSVTAGSCTAAYTFQATLT
ncbi:MAG TPA: cell wall-binding repeat-containing protein [Acidimicrobiales bacterium]|nr:cell wall-binding repeat-containing protein [Acidimicrobiales bacterium]